MEDGAPQGAKAGSKGNDEPTATGIGAESVEPSGDSPKPKTSDGPGEERKVKEEQEQEEEQEEEVDALEAALGERMPWSAFAAREPNHFKGGTRACAFNP